MNVLIGKDVRRELCQNWIGKYYISYYDVDPPHAKRRQLGHSRDMTEEEVRHCCQAERFADDAISSALQARARRAQRKRKASDPVVHVREVFRR